MRAITVRCPKCDEVSDLYLGSDAFMIILNCPNCGIPLIYYYGRTVEVTERELEKIQRSGFLKNAGNLLKEIGEAGTRLQVSKTVKPYLPAVKRTTAQKRRRSRRGETTIHAMGQPLRAEYFTKDDLIDLRIDLATSKTVEDFLEKMP